MRVAFLAIAVLLVVLFFSLKSRASCRVVMIGDSLAYRLDRSGVLAKALGSSCELQSFVVPGSSMLSWANGEHDAVLHRALAALRPGDVLLIVLGTNDCCMKPHVIKNEPLKLRLFLHQLGTARMVWAVPPKLRRRCQENVKPFVNMLRAAGVDMIDSQGINVDMWNDGIHPSDRGQQVWARFIVAELRARSLLGGGLQAD